MPRRSKFCEALLVSAALLAVVQPAHAATLDSTVKSVGQSLQRAWQSDPLARQIPFPPLVLLPAEAPLSQACASSTPAERARGSFYCPAQGTVLLVRRQLKRAMAVQQATGVTYRLAMGLGQAIQAQRSAQADLAPQARNLQATCLGGWLLARGPATSSEQRHALLEADRDAYTSGAALNHGSAEQRAYALLTGMGATSSTCKGASMAALASGMVPDPELLRSIKAERTSNLKTAINSQCRRPPACPRRLQDIDGFSLP